MKRFIVAVLMVLVILIETSVAQEARKVYPTLPGTSIRDYQRPGWIVSPDGKSIHPTIPGTGIRDFTKPGYTRKGNDIYPTLPGTSVRDWSRPGFKMED